MHIIHISDREERENEPEDYDDKEYIQIQKMKGSARCCNTDKHTNTFFFSLLNDFKVEVLNQGQFYTHTHPGHIWPFLETFFLLL